MRTTAHPDHKRLMAFLGDRGPIFSGAANGKAVKWLLHHYSADICEACFADLESQQWRATAISWITVAKEIAQWANRRARDTAKAHFGEWDGVDRYVDEFVGMNEEEKLAKIRRQMGYQKD